MGTYGIPHAASDTNDSWSLLLATALVPVVLVYNVGAFDQVNTAGLRTAVLSALVITCLGVPLMQSVLLVQRIAGRARPVGPTARRPRSMEGRP